MDKKINESKIVLTIAFGVLFILIYSSLFQVSKISQIASFVDVGGGPIPEPERTCICACASKMGLLCSNVSYEEDEIGACESVDYSVTISAIATYGCSKVGGGQCSGSYWDGSTKSWKTSDGLLVFCSEKK